MPISEHWEERQLGSLCDLTNGYAFKPADWGSLGKPIIRIQNLNGGLDFNYFRGSLSERYEVGPGTLLFAWSGNRGTSFGPYIWKGQPGLLNQHIFKVTPKEEINESWFYFALDEVRQRVESNAHGASGLVHVKKQDLCKYIVLTPTRVSEQRAIAAILDSVDETIRQTEAVIAKLRQVKAGMLHDLLTCGLDNNGELRDPIRHPELFKGSPLGRIPKEWEALPLSAITLKIADRDHTTPLYASSGIPMVSPTHFFGEDSIDFARCPFISMKAHLINKRKTDLAPGDILLHRIGAGLGRVRLVKTWMPEFSILHSLAMIRTNNDVANERFICWAFQSNLVQDQLGIGTQSIGVPDLGLDKIGDSKFTLPKSLDEQTLIADRLDAWKEKFNDEVIFKAKCLLIKHGLMHDLLTGTVRVPEHLLEASA